jgi:hypothetical protein
MILSGSADAFGSANSSAIETGNLASSISFDPPKLNPDRAINDSFLVVDKGGLGAESFSSNDSGAAHSRLGQKSAESSGNPAETSGVPMPRAGWISFFGVVGVIAARHVRLSRRRTSRTAMN